MTTVVHPNFREVLDALWAAGAALTGKEISNWSNVRIVHAAIGEAINTIEDEEADYLKKLRREKRKQKWTNDTPTKPGYYWLESTDDEEDCVSLIVDVYKDEGDEGGYTLYAKVPHWLFGVEVSSIIGRWAGPLPKPEEGN